MKQTFIIRDPMAKVYFRDTAIEVKSENGNRIIGFSHIMHLYLHQDINISVKTAIQIAKNVPLHFVDKRAKVLAHLSLDA
jgi:CRISPR/Cas system-associated endonuclease Cas1